MVEENKKTMTREEEIKALKIFKGTLLCQMNDERHIGVITDNHGIRVKRLNIFKRRREKWVPTGKVSPNAWSLK